MQHKDLASAAQPAAVLARVAQQAPLLAQRGGHDQPAPAETIREATHRGHHIVIRTTYRIEVDGIPIEGHLGVTDDGQVHYHAVPNLGFASAVDLVKQLIDVFPDDFPDDHQPPESPHPPDHEHSHDHEHGPEHGHERGA